MVAMLRPKRRTGAQRNLGIAEPEGSALAHIGGFAAQQEVVASAAGNVKKSPAGAGLFTRGLHFSRKLGCGVYTKCLDTHPKRERLGSSSMSDLRTRERALRRPGLVRNPGCTR